MNIYLLFCTAISILHCILIVHCEEILSTENISPSYYELDQECVDYSKAPVDDIEFINSFHPPTTKEGKCLLACMFKKINIISPNGSYLREGSVSAAEKILNSYPKALEKAMEMIELCSIAVEDIEDDESGCEIAATLFSCMATKINGSKMYFSSEEYTD